MVRQPSENRRREKVFDASRYKDLGQLGFSIKGERLKVKAFRVGSVVATSEPCSELMQPGGFEDCAGLPINGDHIYAATGETCNEAFWRTVLLNKSVHLNMKQGSVEFDAVACLTTLHRRVFLTDGAYLGLGPQSIKEGDSIWIVSSCRSPLVLGPSLASSGSEYVLRGESYVHGIMFGEAVIDDIQWTDVCIV
jgi:hypothetical protein